MDYNKTEDRIFKKAMEIFTEGATNFFGTNKKIISVESVALQDIKISETTADYFFLTEDEQYDHYEFCSTYKKSDLENFMHRDLLLYQKHHKKIRAIVVYSSEIKEVETAIDGGSFTYHIHPVYMYSRDGDKEYNRILNKIQNMEEITKEDLCSIVFLPLMQSKNTKNEILSKSIYLAKELNNNLKSEVFVMLYALVQKFGDENFKLKMKEELIMTDVGKMLVEEGMQKGILEGRQEGLQEKLKSLILKKLSKNKTQNEIINELEIEDEEELMLVKNLCQAS